MANDALADIRTQLVSELGEISSLQEVITGRTFENSGSPYCRVFISSISNETLTNEPSYLRTYGFTIQIVQDASAKAKTVAETDLENILDEVLDKLGTEWNLNNNAELTDNLGGTIEELETDHGVALVATINISVKTHVTS